MPVTVDCKQAKVTLLESDLEAYPGMFVQPDGKQTLKGVFAPYPKKTDFYPWRKQEYVTETVSVAYLGYNRKGYGNAGE